MSEDLRIPVIEERAHVEKRRSTERVRVTTSPVAEEVLVRDAVRQEAVEVTRVPVGREVTEAPQTRVEGDVTIIPVLEERLIVEKRLVLVEEVHVRRTAVTEAVEISATLRRTRVDVERTPSHQETD